MRYNSTEYLNFLKEKENEPLSEQTSGNTDAHNDNLGSVAIGYGLDLTQNSIADINAALKTAGETELTSAQQTAINAMKAKRKELLEDNDNKAFTKWSKADRDALNLEYSTQLSNLNLSISVSSAETILKDVFLPKAVAGLKSNLSNEGVDLNRLDSGLQTALVDLAYNAGSASSTDAKAPSLNKALDKLVDSDPSNDHLAYGEAFYEIGYNYNASGSTGIAKRREESVDNFRNEISANLTHEEMLEVIKYLETKDKPGLDDLVDELKAEQVEKANNEGRNTSKPSENYHHTSNGHVYHFYSTWDAVKNKWVRQYNLYQAPAKPIWLPIDGGQSYALFKYEFNETTKKFSNGREYQANTRKYKPNNTWKEASR